MAVYFVCTTHGCRRNKPRRFVYAATVTARGHARCEECGQVMARRVSPLKGPNVKRGLRLKSSWPTKPSTRKAGRKKIGPTKRFYKR